MDFKLLIKDIVSLNFSSYHYRVEKARTNISKVVADFLLSRNLRSLYSIPVIINNRNRYTYLLQLISWLENAGFTNIYIIDNASSYPPLIDYYKSTKHTVFQLKENIGYLSLWQTDIYKRFKYTYYIYTDPDVVPDESCPRDFTKFFYEKLQAHTTISKIGFGLRIDDLPEHYQLKEKVIEWESQFWLRQVEEKLYDADIDTTFALYKPGAQGGYWAKAYRTGFPYVARHLPWYENTANPAAEDVYYVENSKKSTTHWTRQA